MKVFVAIDSFKGSLSSMQAGNAVKEAVLQVDPGAEVTVLPIADGGEGTVEALCAGLGGELQEVTVSGPLGDPVKAQYCILPDGKTAVMEMSAAAGITLIPASSRNPMLTTTYGVGEIIADAISRGCRHFIVGIGGSATNDGGVGMLSALGFRFLDGKGEPISAGAAGLEKLASICLDEVLPQLKECTFRIACDVTNPLCGEKGCSAVYGPQKGADQEMIRKMDAWLNRYADLVSSVFPGADKEYPGVGAAGGLGFAFRSFLNGELQSGIQIILDEIKVEKYIKNADIVVTGEGRLDYQTVMGKAPVGIANIAKKHGKKVIAFSGCLGENAAVCNDHGIDAFFPILPGVMTLDEAMNPETAYDNLRNTAVQVFRLMCL